MTNITSTSEDKIPKDGKAVLCHATKQKIADHEYTVLYDGNGNKYLMLEKFDLDFKPRFDGLYDKPLNPLALKKYGGVS